MSETLESAAKTAQSLKTVLGIGIGLIIGAFATGFTLKAQYDQINTSYHAILALQENKWGNPVTEPPPVGAASAPGQTICPNGSYMVGVKVPFQANAVTVIQPICRPLGLK
jgi:hypothetical protein